MSRKINQVRLQRLCAVIEEGSLSGAGERLGLSQPALSASIAMLESDLGVRLVERGRSGAVPTVFGSYLYERAKIIDAELERAARELEDMARGNKGKLAVGATSGAAMTLCALTICQLRVSHPGLSIELVVDPSSIALLSRLRRRELDIVICPPLGLQPDEDLTEERLFKTRRVVITRPGHPLAKKKKFDVREIPNYCIVRPNDAHGMTKIIYEIFERSGLPLPGSSVICDTVEGTKEIVLHSDCFSVLTEASVMMELRDGSIKNFLFDVPTEYWFKIMRRAGQHVMPAMKSFLMSFAGVCNSHEMPIDHRRVEKFLAVRE